MGVLVMTEELIARIQHRADQPSTRTDHAEISVPPRFAPVTAVELARAEQELGFGLPPFLAQVYRRVGNGGFGPAYGLIGLPGGFAHDEGSSIVELYDSYHSHYPNTPDWQWPERLVPICNWGSAIFSCVDCHTGSIITFDPGQQPEGEPMTLAFAKSHSDVAAWFDDWVNGIGIWDKMYEHDPAHDKEIIDPFTRKRMVVRGKRFRW
jgi:hypothetical protein